jgi:simple sugar transport system ATP-binding protein
VTGPANGGWLVEAQGLRKSFGRVEVLRGVDLRLRAGEVVALLGDNGAGKSTLIKILTGLHRPDAGTLRWKGEEVHFRSPRDAYARGVATVYQDLGLVDKMSVYRNLFLGRESEVLRGVGPLKWIDRSRARRETCDAMETLGITIRSPDEPVARLSGGQRQSIAIARGVHFSAELLILDEPTSALSIAQTTEVLRTIEQAARRGIGVIVISHNVHEVFPVAHRFVVLARGETLATLEAGECSKETLTDLVLEGRRRAATFGRGER